MKKLFTALVALVLSLSVSAQFYIYCSNGDVLEVDSISLVKPDNSNKQEDNSNNNEDNSNNQINNHEYVDLGLPSGLKWATCNVGATTPEEYGDYFAWGEVEPKTTYNLDTYKYYDGSNFTKYTGSDKTVLDPEDDAAYVNWGGAWRMPTKAEQDELRRKCKWVWTTQNGVKGYKVEGPNGNSIFLPAAGYMYEGSLYDAGSLGVYWSSSLDTGDPGLAYGVYFDSDDVGLNDNGRDGGQSVRPVCQ